MKLDVVSEDVLPSERLKRLLRLGNFLGSCDQRDTHTHTHTSEGMDEDHGQRAEDMQPSKIKAYIE